MPLQFHVVLMLLLTSVLVGCASVDPQLAINKATAQSLLQAKAQRMGEAKPVALTLIDEKDFIPAVASNQRGENATIDNRVVAVNKLKHEAIASPNELFELSAQAKQHFINYLEDPANRKYPKHKRVFNYLNRILGNFNYYSDTYTAQQTLDNNSGNCMSLAILTTSYAELAGLEFQYNRVDSAPVFGQAGRFEVASTHVATKLFDPTFVPKLGMLYIRKPFLLVDYFPTRNNWVGGKVDREAFVAMYYRNMAVQKMAEEDFNSAGLYAIKALQHAPFDTDGINVMAVIYKQIKQQEKAEALYRYGLSLTDSNINLLYNYQLLLISQERVDEAEALNARLEKLEDPSPFPYLRLADEALAKSQPDLALRYYQKSIEKAHYLPHGYVGAAKAYHAKGKLRAAREQLKLAIERTHESDDERLFRAKLASLSD